MAKKTVKESFLTFPAEESQLEDILGELYQPEPEKE